MQTNKNGHYMQCILLRKTTNSLRFFYVRRGGLNVQSLSCLLVMASVRVSSVETLRLRLLGRELKIKLFK